MPLYADVPARRTRQIIADVVAVAVIAGALWTGAVVRELVLELRGPGERLSEAGAGLRGSFEGAAEAAGRIPAVGDSLAEGLGRGGAAGDSLVSIGQAQVAAVEQAAWWLAVLLVLGPVLLTLVLWLPWRIRYARRSGAARRLAMSGQQDLLALRALTHVPLDRLARISADPAAAWRQGDPDVVADLAAAELRSHGLRPFPATAHPVARS